MIPTATDVYIATRAIFEDNAVPDGDRWGDDKLQPFLRTAYEEIFNQARLLDINLIRQWGYFNLAAYSGILMPEVAKLANIDTPAELSARAYTSTWGISNITSALGAGRITVTTATPHGRASGDEVVHTAIEGIPPEVNGKHLIEVAGASSYYVNGIEFAIGVYTANSGTGTYSASQFQPVNELPDRNAPKNSVTVAGELCNWLWDGRKFIFLPAANVARQLQIRYEVSGTLPINPAFPLVVDGSLGYFANRVAGLCFMNMNPALSQLWNAAALGPTRNPEDIGGMLGAILKPDMRQENRFPIHRPGFRPRRLNRPGRSRAGSGTGGICW